MRKAYRAILKHHFYNALIHARDDAQLTQAQMAEKLCMDERSYVDLDHGKACCSAITLALFLIYVCEDVAEFLEELRYAFEAEADCAA